jgi:hypothetical protein
VTGNPVPRRFGWFTDRVIINIYMYIFFFFFLQAMYTEDRIVHRVLVKRFHIADIVDIYIVDIYIVESRSRSWCPNFQYEMPKGKQLHQLPYFGPQLGQFLSKTIP